MGLALVTGGSGFIGRRLVRELQATGEDVRVLDARPPEGAPGIDGAEFVRGSVLDRDAVEAALKGADRLYHLAGIAHLWVTDPKNFDAVNRQGTETVLKAAARRGTRRVVHCSTESILLPPRGRAAGAVDESVRPPLAEMPGPYTRSKWRAEEAALTAAREGMDAVVVNPTVPIGAGDSNMTPPAKMLAMFLAGRSPVYLDCVLNLAGVDDIAKGIVLAGERGRSGERYILGGENVALKDLLRRVGALSGRPMPGRTIPPLLALAAAAAAEWGGFLTRREPAATREGVCLALRSRPFDSGKAAHELGYRPSPVQDSLATAVMWLGRRGAANEPHG